MGFSIRDSRDFTVCNLNNLANTFEIAASKQLMPFLLVWIKHRDYTKDLQKNIGYFKDGTFESALGKKGKKENNYYCN